MKSLRKLAVISLTSMGLMLTAAVAKADPLSLTFASPDPNAAAGQTISFDATVTDIGSTVVYLNGDDLIASGSLLLDDSPFLNNFPISMNPGNSDTDELFTVTVPLGTPIGFYSGSFTIIGGSDGNAQNAVGSADFGVNVSGNATPEPSSLVLLLTGVAGIAGTLRRRLIR